MIKTFGSREPFFFEPKVPDELPAGRHVGDAGHLAGREARVQTRGVQAVDAAHVWRIR